MAKKTEDIPVPYLEVIRDLEAKGRPSGWVLRTVDPAESGSVFVKDGKPWYKSLCSCYKGYWLNGGVGSVQCKNSGGLLPGIHHMLFCGKDPEQCPYQKRGQSELLQTNA